MLIQHFRVMRSYNFKNRSSWNEVMKNYWPVGMLGVTTGKDDNFICIDCLGTMDGEGILKCCSIYDTVLHYLSYIETYVMPALRRREAETGRQCGLVVIQDLDKAPLNTTT